MLGATEKPQKDQAGEHENPSKGYTRAESADPLMNHG